MVPTAYLWTRDVSFRNWIESTINMSFLSITKTFKRIIHRRGSTSWEPPLTKAPLYSVCRVKTSNFFFNRDSPQNMHNGHIHVHICVKWYINAQSCFWQLIYGTWDVQSWMTIKKTEISAQHEFPKPIYLCVHRGIVLIYLDVHQKC